MKKYTKWIISAICALALVTTSVAATNAPSIADDSSPWVLTLGGSGATATDASSTVLGGDISLGLTFNVVLPVELGVRQSVSFANANGDSTVLGTTRLYGDVTVFTFKRLDVFAGAAVGVTYGDGIDPAWEVAPEAGARLWLKKDVAVLARAEVPWSVNNWQNWDSWEFKNTVRYFLGIQVKL